MRIPIIVAGLASLTLAGCSNFLGSPERQGRWLPGSELVGQTMRVESAGRTSMMRFARDGSVHASFSGHDLDGRWNVEPGKICFTWGKVRDCWPYARPFRQGERMMLKSDRGNNVQATLL
jgi:hypothetical protein